jgi:hypothetical protein
VDFAEPGPLPDLVDDPSEPVDEAPVVTAPPPPAPEPFGASAGEQLPPAVIPDDCGGPCERDLVP